MGGADHIIERNGEQIGHVIMSKVTKNKLSSPFKSAEFSIEYLKGVVDKQEELRVLGAKYGVIQRPNNKAHIYKSETYNGKAAMCAALNTEETQKALWSEIVDARATFVELEQATEAADNVEDSDNDE